MQGSCKCGNISFDWRTHRQPDDFRPRACTCSLCASFDAAYVSDSDSQVEYRIKDSAQLDCRKSGTGTAAFLICANCNELILVTSEVDGNTYAVLNIRAIKDVQWSEPVPAAFDEENVEQRLQRRKRNWISKVVLAAS